MTWHRFVMVSVLCALTSCAARTQPTPVGPAELYWLLDRACVSGDERSVQMLLKAGADPTGVQGYEAFHQSSWQIGLEPSWPINQAASGGHTAVISLLLAAGAKADAPEGEGQTALLIAAHRGDMNTVRLLLESGASKTYRAAWLGGDSPRTAEELAARAGHNEVAAFIHDFGTAK